jgi:hypothetical protein
VLVKVAGTEFESDSLLLTKMTPLVELKLLPLGGNNTRNCVLLPVPTG